MKVYQMLCFYRMDSISLKFSSAYLQISSLAFKTTEAANKNTTVDARYAAENRCLTILLYSFLAKVA